MGKTKSIKPVETVLLSSPLHNINGLKKFNDDIDGTLFTDESATGEHFVINKDIKTNEISRMTDIEQLTKAVDAFVFRPIPTRMPSPTLPERQAFLRKMSQISSLFVGGQTWDPNLKLDAGNEHSPLKPVVLMNHDHCYDPVFKLADHMHEMGTITQEPRDILKNASKPKEMVKILRDAHLVRPVIPRHTDHHHPKNAELPKDSGRPKPDFNVCVFCSASTKNPQLLASGREIGRSLALRDWGLISGMGGTGIMGAIVDGAAAVIRRFNRGWVGGSNLPRIIRKEGTPSYCDKFWPRDDIYTRMQVMVEESQAFILMPGGFGTVQEGMALLMAKYVEKEKGKHNLMHDEKFGNKPIIIVNHDMGHGQRFWDPMIEMADRFGFKKDIVVVDNVREAVQKLEEHYKHHAVKGISARSIKPHDITRGGMTIGAA